MAIEKIQQLIQKVNAIAEKKGVNKILVKVAKKSAVAAANSQLNKLKKLSDEEYAKKKSNSDTEYNAFLATIKPILAKAKIDFDKVINVVEDKVTDVVEKFTEERKTKSFIKKMEGFKAEIVDNSVKKTIDDNIAWLTTELENTKKESDSNEKLKKYNSEDGTGKFYNKFTETKNLYENELRKRIAFANRIESSKSEFDSTQAPATFNWSNTEQNFKLFELSSKMYDDITAGEFFEQTEDNPSYDTVIDTEEVKGLITKYKNKFKTEIDAGRGLLSEDKAAMVAIEDVDVTTLQPLITFNDNYTAKQIAKWNLLRTKLHLPALQDASSTLNANEKAKLILQGILGFTRIESNNSNVSTVHSYNKGTDEVVKAHNWNYGDIYYSSFSTPLVSDDNVGITSDFLSTVLFKSTLGERKAYKQYGLTSEEKVKEWGHLLAALDKNAKYYYGVVIAEETGMNETVPLRTNYKVYINDMFFKK
ncbi:hypothetical protein [Mycoplasma bradburyae]|uniref:hypothetical protein n=1 Tax=Mycoplasma bradburyae TaxID=2963128 RepID=UPI00234261C8|nr:hypothetical protein [Mycoplasma bradburyae]MDC4184275.1 hypothetical protein [Mycoplasma bradburyae]